MNTRNRRLTTVSLLVCCWLKLRSDYVITSSIRDRPLVQLRWLPTNLQEVGIGSSHTQWASLMTQRFYRCYNQTSWLLYNIVLCPSFQKQRETLAVATAEARGSYISEKVFKNSEKNANRSQVSLRTSRWIQLRTRFSKKKKQQMTRRHLQSSFSRLTEL